MFYCGYGYNDLFILLYHVYVEKATRQKNILRGGKFMANIIMPGHTYNIESDLAIILAQVRLETRGVYTFDPVLSESDKWLRWIAVISPLTCVYCFNKNGTIYDQFNKFEIDQVNIPAHENCNCYLEQLKAIIAGTATMDGKNGADYWIKNYQILPSNYVSKEHAKSNGWKKSKGNLRKVLPNAIMGGGLFHNDKGKLPDAPGRIWYEADINYTGSYRNNDRVLYSNDGLLFVTYNHYYTFYEIK